MMTNGDPEGRIFLSYPHTNNGFFFLRTTVFFIMAPPTYVGRALLILACPSVCPSVCLSVRCYGHSNLVIFNRISFIFIYGLLPSMSGSSLNKALFDDR